MHLSKLISEVYKLAFIHVRQRFKAKKLTKRVTLLSRKTLGKESKLKLKYLS